MTTKITRRAFCSMLLALPFSVRAQQATKKPRIGYLGNVSLSANAARVEAFRHGLRKLGYVEGENIFIEYRYAEGKRDRIPALAAELVRLNVDIIVTGGGSATRAAKNATSTIPIVMTNDPDPVANGYVASLARPTGNVTGLSTLAPELSGKRLEILREVVPKLSRVAVFGTSTNPGHAQLRKELETAAKAFALELQYMDVRDFDGIEGAFQAAEKAGAEGVLTVESGILVLHRARTIALAAKSRLPTMFHRAEFVVDGGLMFYGVNLLDLQRRAATFVDKILRGRAPAELPVEQPMKFDFIVNLKTANSIGRTIPPNVLVRASKVIR